jgi:hypothetical protein
MSNTYKNLLSEPLQYVVCQYGNGVALGFEGNKEFIDKAHTLFCNFDANKKLNWLNNDFAYISSTMAKIKEAVKLYLYVNILHAKEVQTKELWDEENGIYTLIQDEDTANQLAEAEATDFMSRLKTVSFIPASRKNYG